jgi:hypothetical protein
MAITKWSISELAGACFVMAVTAFFRLPSRSTLLRRWASVPNPPDAWEAEEDWGRERWYSLATDSNEAARFPSIAAPFALVAVAYEHQPGMD